MSTRLDMLRKLVAARPTDPFYIYGLAMELKSARIDEEALAAFADLEVRFPEYVAQYLMHAYLLVDLGRGDEAKALLERGMKVAEGQGQTHAHDQMRGLLETL